MRHFHKLSELNLLCYLAITTNCVWYHTLYKSFVALSVRGYPVHKQADSRKTPEAQAIFHSVPDCES